MFFDKKLKLISEENLKKINHLNISAQNFFNYILY